MGVWPTVPAEGIFTDVERSFIENSPDGYWPDNQDSNFGQIRRVTTDPLQECVDFLAILHFEMFVQTASRYLDLWEELANVPVDPTGLTIADRRALVLAVLRKGPFTRARRDALINTYVQIGFGQPIMLVPEGVPIPVEGLPLYDEFDPSSPPFRVVETVEDYYYSIRIRNGTSVNAQGLADALTYLQYAGLHFTVDFVPSPTVPWSAIRDDFARADVNPLTKDVGFGAMWGGSISNSGLRLKIVSNQVQAATAAGSAYWWETYPAAQEVWAKNVSNGNIKLYLRITDEGTATWDGYYVELKGAGNTTADFYKVVNGTPTLLVSRTVSGYTANDVWVFRAVGNQLTLYRNGFIEPNGTVTDGSITGAGKIGLSITNTGINVDNFGGGPVS